MKYKLKLCMLGLLTMVCMPSLAGGSEDQKMNNCQLYRIYLKNKKYSEYSISRPSQFLSKRALERRQRYNIHVDSTDLPISNYYKRLIAENDATILLESKWNNTILVRARTAEMCGKVKNLPFVMDIKPVCTMEVQENASKRTITMPFNGFTVPADRSIRDVVSKGLNGEALYGSGLDGSGILISIIDGGFANLKDISAFQQMKIVGIRNFVPYAPSDIYLGTDHGTKVASILAANVPGKYLGLAPGAEYLLIRTEDAEREVLAEEDYWATGVEYADSMGTDLISSSLGYNMVNDSLQENRSEMLDGESTLISHTASFLQKKGIILVVSAGNNGMDSWKMINVPADAKEIISVGATDRKGQNAPFSSIGFTSDGRIKPDVTAVGCNVPIINGFGKITIGNGTSFSAPIIAGLTACLWQRHKELNARQIISMVKHSCDQWNKPDNIRGYGIPDYKKALYDNIFKYK